MPGSERRRELRRRRHRKKKLAVLERRAKTGTSGEKAAIAEKLRALTPGAEIIIQDWSLE